MKKSKAGRPLKGQEKRIRTSLTLPPQTLAWIDAQAESLKISRSDYLVFLSRISPKLPLQELRILARIPLSQDFLKDFCKKYHVKKLSLFGSVLRDDFTAQSDIDILVEFDPKHIPGYFTLSEMEIKLSESFKRKVDLRTAQELSKYFRNEVLQEAQVIYAA